MQNTCCDVYAVKREIRNIIWARGGRRDKPGEMGAAGNTLPHLKQVSDLGPTVDSRNSPRHSVMTYVGKDSKKQWVYAHI